MTSPGLVERTVKVTAVAPRIMSVDIFRGLAMLVMIFVNDLAGVHGLPWWTYHAPARVDAMTYVDMVFPAFLFVMGLSLPLAIQSRLTRGASLKELWMHIAVRSLILMLLGLILANAAKADSSRMPLPVPAHLWALLALLGGVLWIAKYPSAVARRWQVNSKILGVFLLAAMFVIFRRSDHQGHTRWLDFSYWEILGIIGWTYLAVCVLYVPLRHRLKAQVFVLAVLCAFNSVTAAHLIPFPNRLPLYLWPWSNGAFVILTMSGIITANVVLSDEWVRPLSRKMKLSAAFGVVLLLAGALAVPLGISKIRATPTWCLVSAGASVFVFLLLYWWCDLRGQTAWAAFVRPAGQNTLLTYLLPDFFFFAVSLAWLPAAWSWGLLGVLRALIFTALMLAIAAILTRWRIRLQL